MKRPYCRLSTVEALNKRHDSVSKPIKRLENQRASKGMLSPSLKRTAGQCRHYAMCKIDYLGTGLCPSAGNGNYVSYYPQGRMDIYHALAENRIPVTERLLDIADTCSLCGICDRQCYFVTGLRPRKVMQGLKEYVERFRRDGRGIEKTNEDDILSELRHAVGENWATNDPAILVSYAGDPCPLTGTVLPKYVVVPESKEEISAIMKICGYHGLRFAVRGNGGSVMGFVMSPGLVIDMNRMRGMDFDEENWSVKVGAGMSAFEVQKEAYKRGFRINAAEPSALVAANIMCSGIFSLFSNVYGISADNYVNAEFVGKGGEYFDLNSPDAPNLFAYRQEERPMPGVCTSVTVKLHPVTDDEEGVLLPFSSLPEAIKCARELSQRRLGIGIGIIGGEYLSSFISPTSELAREVRNVFCEKLGINYLIVFIGDRYDLESLRNMNLSMFSNRLFRALVLGLPNLAGNGMLEGLKSSDPEYPLSKLLAKEEMLPLVEAALEPSPGCIASAVERDLRPFFEDIYEKAEMTDLVWLNMFRILSSRMGRSKHALAFILYVPLNSPQVICDIEGDFKRIADSYGIKGDYGFITPLDFGKRGVFEYDWYIDHTDPEDVQRAQMAIVEAARMIEGYSSSVKGLRWIKYTLYQGFCRSENLLYT